MSHQLCDYRENPRPTRRVGYWTLQEKEPFTTRKPRHSLIYVTQKRVTLKKCHLFKKFKDLGHALLRALKLVSHVKKLKTRRALYLKCASSVSFAL